MQDLTLVWRTLKAQQLDDEAAVVEGQFNAAWKEATVKLSIEDL